MAKEKNELDNLLSSLNKEYGDGSVMKLGDKPSKFESVSSGSIKLDQALGAGFAKGRVIEIYGQEATGKTGLLLNAIAVSQRNGGRCAIIDVENALNTEYAEKIGVNIQDLVISQPDNAETAMGIARKMINSGLFDIIGLDSVAGLSTKAELSGEIGEAKIATTARLMSQTLRMIVGEVNKTNTCFIFINQIRMKIGVMFGNPETTTGGNALKFASSQRVEVRRSIKTVDGDTKGFIQKIKIVKNKMSPAYKKLERYIDFTEGIHPFGELCDLGVEYGIIDKKGSWFSYNETKLGQGRDAALNILSDNPELCDEILVKIKEKLAN